MITVFTATYNRGYIIENLYHSLERQTCKDFEWIVIDDGSNDNTEFLLHKWQNDTKNFSVKYKKILNGGKHRAINIGVTMATTDAFFIVDSDDYLVENAIEQVQNWFYPICKDPQYAGVSGLKGYSIDTPLGGWGKFSGEYVDASNLERKRYGLLQDKAEVYKTSILKKYPFPEFENETFLTEGIIWNKIAYEGYKLRWYKKIIYICNYLEDGLTHCGYNRSIKNPKGYMAYLNLMSQIYGKKFGYIHKFGFYFILRNNNESIEQCRNKMHVTLQELNALETKYQQMILDMKKYFRQSNIKNIAIYGLGNVGNAFLTIAEKLDLNVNYAIDNHQMKNQKIKIYSPTDTFPSVDGIIITLKDYHKNVEQHLKLSFNIVVYWKDISLEYWCN